MGLRGVAWREVGRGGVGWDERGGAGQGGAEGRFMVVN